MKSNIGQLKEPPLSVALQQAVKSIRMRPMRQLFTALGVMLGIALYAAVRTMQMLSSLSEKDGMAEMENRLRWLVFVSLVMCFVGIMNSMLMSVTERYREIGTLKCLGALDSFIVKLFFLEALILGSIASISGGLFGILIAYVVKGFTGGWHEIVQAGFRAVPIFGTSLLLGVTIAIVAAILPAFQAARMPAAAALRVEV